MALQRQGFFIGDDEMPQIGMRLTRAGSDLLAKGMLGKEIHFTRGALGSGNFDYETEAVFDLTEMRKWEMDIPIESIEKIGDGTVKIVCHKTNAEVYDGFPAREHAVFATDPDTGKEILYSYCNTGEEYSFIPSNNSPVTKDIKFSYVTIIRDAENVTATLDLSFAYTSTTDFDNHINSKHPHPNTPNHFDNVTATSHIWATDEDNHLHKLSVNNLKTLLREDTETSTELSEEEKIFRAKNELGLDANLLLIEDFCGESVTDNYKIKVTSSAENGSLLGLESVEDLQTGAYYTISDGYNQEIVQIASVRYNVSGYHAKLKNRLDNPYDWRNTYLYRTTPKVCNKKVLTWQPAGGFGGVEANIARELPLLTTIENAQDFEISGDGFLDVDGSFSIC